MAYIPPPSHNSGDSLSITPGVIAYLAVALIVWIAAAVAVARRGRRMVHIPLDRVEELIAGIRDTARQAAPGRCGCGKPSTPGTTHRTDRPCYVDDAKGTR